MISIFGRQFNLPLNHNSINNTLHFSTKTHLMCGKKNHENQLMKIIGISETQPELLMSLERNS